MPVWIRQHTDYQRFLTPLFSIRTAHFYVPVLRSEDDFRLGITISRKVGNAVLRNYLRRRIKAWFREREFQLPYAVNLVARKGAGQLTWLELCTELQQITTGLAQKALPSQ